MAYTNLFIIGTAGIVCGAGSVHVGRLPVPAWAAAANFAAVVYQLLHTHSSQRGMQQANVGLCCVHT